MSDKWIWEKRVNRGIDLLIEGDGWRYSKIPLNIKNLFENMKEHGFIAGDTKIENFIVPFGYPFESRIVLFENGGKYTEFEPIQWMKNRALFRFFLSSIISNDALKYCGQIISERLFVDKYGFKMTYPKVDYPRLNFSSDFETLHNLLTEAMFLR